MKMKRIGYLLILLALLLFGGLCVILIPKFLDYHKSWEFYRDLETEYTTEEEVPQKELERILVDMEVTHPFSEYTCIDVDGEALYRENEDYIGWIYIPKTRISYPVVKSKDNSDYLHVNFQKNYNYPGTIFMDRDCKNGILNHHTILYGHNMGDGSMFAGIHKFKEKDYVEEHPVFWLITPKYKLLYQVIAVNTVDPLDRQLYGVDGIDYKNNLEFLEAMESLQQNSLVPVEYELSEEDYIMTLSTCTGNPNVRLILSGVLRGAIQ